MLNKDEIKEIEQGLSLYPKKISSKFFYDAQGDELFQEIMRLPEYYLTRAEQQIFNAYADQIIEDIGWVPELDVYELGAGDGSKTTTLLRAFKDKGIHVNYKPIDISLNVLKQLEVNVKRVLADQQVELIQSSYTAALNFIDEENEAPKLFMFLGSNLGNLPHKNAIEFLKNISDHMGERDHLLMGLDKVKEPAKVLAAYNDKSGVTRAFNMNLLKRLNRELEADFDLDSFEHVPVYDPESGTASSFLVSTKEQVVRFGLLGKSFHFDAWESIHTEISQKYSISTIEWLCESAHLKLKEVYTDEEQLFYECLIKKADESHLE